MWKFLDFIIPHLTLAAGWQSRQAHAHQEGTLYIGEHFATAIIRRGICNDAVDNRPQGGQEETTHAAKGLRKAMTKESNESNTQQKKTLNSQVWILQQLCFASRTLCNCATSMYEKLGTKAIRVALAHGLISSNQTATPSTNVSLQPTGCRSLSKGTNNQNVLPFNTACNGLWFVQQKESKAGSYIQEMFGKL